MRIPVAAAIRNRADDEHDKQQRISTSGNPHRALLSRALPCSLSLMQVHAAVCIHQDLIDFQETSPTVNESKAKRIFKTVAWAAGLRPFQTSAVANNKVRIFMGDRVQQSQ